MWLLQIVNVINLLIFAGTVIIVYYFAYIVSHATHTPHVLLQILDVAGFGRKVVTEDVRNLFREFVNYICLYSSAISF